MQPVQNLVAAFRPGFAASSSSLGHWQLQRRCVLPRGPTLFGRAFVLSVSPHCAFDCLSRLRRACKSEITPQLLWGHELYPTLRFLWHNMPQRILQTRSTSWHVAYDKAIEPLSKVVVKYFLDFQSWAGAVVHSQQHAVQIPYMSHLLHTFAHHFGCLHHPNDVLIRKVLVAEQLARTAEVENWVTHVVKANNTQVARQFELLFRQKFLVALTPHQCMLELWSCTVKVSAALAQKSATDVHVAVLLRKGRQSYVGRIGLNSPHEILAQLKLLFRGRLQIAMHFIWQQPWHGVRLGRAVFRGAAGAAAAVLATSAAA
mmetsp:Transcript_42902/g.100707  ORF Transcript_42902/g.100707 Transcript_42902/m.100707 type:complete len:316 (+) Transcript_42902:390-1337(+)